MEMEYWRYDVIRCNKIFIHRFSKIYLGVPLKWGIGTPIFKKGRLWRYNQQKNTMLRINGMAVSQVDVLQGLVFDWCFVTVIVWSKGKFPGIFL
jgi:hypothetical protein